MILYCSLIQHQDWLTVRCACPDCPPVAEDLGRLEARPLVTWAHLLGKLFSHIFQITLVDLCIVSIENAGFLVWSHAHNSRTVSRESWMRSKESLLSKNLSLLTAWRRNNVQLYNKLPLSLQPRTKAPAASLCFAQTTLFHIVEQHIKNSKLCQHFSL